MAGDVLDTDEPSAPSGSGASRRVGPFTLQVWALIIVGGAGAGLLIRRFTASSSPAASTTAADQAAADAANYGYTTTGGPLAGSGATGVTASTTTAPASTNLEWASEALNFLIANGSDPAMSQQAIGGYLDGTPLTLQQKNLVSLAIRYAGAPPEGAPPIQDAATPADVSPGANIQNVSTPLQNPAQSTTPPVGNPAPAPLNPAQQTWVGAVVNTIGLLNQGGATAEANFGRAQGLGISSHDPTLQPWVGIAYYGWLKSQGDPNHLT